MRDDAFVPRPRSTRGALLLAIVAGAGWAATASPDSGEMLYQRYCAACHGAAGRGDGPAAGALCPPPTDLTRLERDEAALMALIDGRRPVRAHGTSAMPIWGEVFEASLIGEPHARRTALFRVQSLARHVQKLGRPGDGERKSSAP